MWPFSSRKRAAQVKDEERRRKVAQSQLALLEAATTTADAAHLVTTRLRQHLEDSIRQFESTVRLLTDALLVCDADGKVKAVNPAAEHIFASRSLINTRVIDLFRYHGKVPASCDDLWTAMHANEDGASDNAPLKGLRANGEVFPIEASTTRLDRTDGTTVVLMLVRDMSTCIAARRAAELHEARYHSLFDVSFDGILIVQEGRVVAANRAAGATFGRSAESLLTLPVETLMVERDRTRVAAMDDTASDGPVEANAVRNDGTTVQLLLSSATIMWNDAPACLMTVKDVSAMRRLETAAHRDNGVDMICCFGPDFRIAFANEAFCRYYGAERASLTGKDIRDLLPHDQRDTFLLSLRGLTPQSPIRRIQVQTPGADGTTHLYDWIDHATFDADGNPVEYQRTGRDISDILTRLLTGRS